MHTQCRPPQCSVAAGSGGTYVHHQPATKWGQRCGMVTLATMGYRKGFTMSINLQFRGSLDRLKDKLLPLDLDGDWQEQPNGVWKVKCSDRSGLLWSSTRGTIWFDGPPVAKEALASRVADLFANPDSAWSRAISQ